MLTLFNKIYDGESLYDAYRDFSEALDAQFNPAVEQIPQDKHGFQLGEFKVTITWQNITN